ncbi:MAG: hypothetical protein AB7F35_27415 [Acetobacteraceae bacterium]
MAVSSTAVIAGIASVLSLVSTGIGIKAAWENQELKVMADAQAIWIAKQDGLIREHAEHRAQTSAERDHTFKVVETLTKALETTDARRQYVALALVQTVSDDGLRTRLAATFQAIPELDSGVRENARTVQTQAEVAVQQQRLAEGADWKYDVFWCTDQPSNQATAAHVVTTMKNAGLSRVTLRPWNARANLQLDPNGSGLQIRAERSEQDQAKFIPDRVKEKNALDFDIFVINGNTGIM